MSCTTVLAGRAATNDGSTMIARTDDGHFDVKKLVTVTPDQQPKVYKSVLSQVEIPLPENPLAYTACPSVDPAKGIWAATGINRANVGMTATETITTNPRVLAADPLVVRQGDTPGGIGEEDMVVLVLPYIRTAREGVLRLGELLEQYGTYESNGIAFNDEKEVWWMETIGGHHWIAQRVPDEMVVIQPNRFGQDKFDLGDALGAGEKHLCSKDLADFIAANYLDANQNWAFDPRKVFGSFSDLDHVYNTPRAWFMGRYLTPRSIRWEGPDAQYTPESDDIPWALVPERKVAVEDVKYLLSGHYQGTPYDPYTTRHPATGGMYRSIGINRTGVTSVCQIRPYAPEGVKGVEWVCFGSTVYSALLPVYPQADAMPPYLSGVTLDVSTENFYWSSRLLGALADPWFGSCIQNVERYHNAVFAQGRRLIREYDAKIAQTGDLALCSEANEKLCAMAKEQTMTVLGKVLQEASTRMRNGYDRADN